MRFSELHPAVNLAWFAAVGAVTVIFMNPILLATVLMASSILAFRLGARRSGVILVPIMFFAALVNSLFTHEGVTVLAYFPSGNPLTLESIVYGLSAALMIGAALMLCICFSHIVTSDKLMWLIGRILPSFAMLLSLILRFVPRFTSHLKDAYGARCALMGEPKGKLKKLSLAASVMSGTVTWALDNSLDCADSMKSRGWGLCRRTSFSVFRFEERDLLSLVIILALAFFTACAGVFGAYDFRFYPSIKLPEATSMTPAFPIAFFILCFYPLILEVSHGTDKN